MQDNLVRRSEIKLGNMKDSSRDDEISTHGLNKNSFHFIVYSIVIPSFNFCLEIKTVIQGFPQSKENFHNKPY